MSLNTVSHNRSVYSILDFLGDVGGLYSILMNIGSLAILVPSFLFGSLMDKFLAKRIFNGRNQINNELVDQKVKINYICFRDRQKARIR